MKGRGMAGRVRPGSVFVSYSHKQGKWVWDRLVPCLRAGYADYRIDAGRFEAGKGVIGQMDSVQDECEKTVLVLSPDYLASKYCRHEMNRAIAKDPAFANGRVIPAMRSQCKLPTKIQHPRPLYVDLRNDRKHDQWELLLAACQADLGARAPHWLEVRNKVSRFLRRRNSVNLVVRGKPKWRELIADIRDASFPEMGEVDLQAPATASRRGLVSKMLLACGVQSKVPDEPEDLVHLGRNFENRRFTRIALTHFDLAGTRPHYGVDLFSSLRYLMMEAGKLALLVHSREHFANLLPPDNPLSTIVIETVELRGEP
jgi:hypothetical protein